MAVPFFLLPLHSLSRIPELLEAPDRQEAEAYRVPSTASSEPGALSDCPALPALRVLLLLFT